MADSQEHLEFGPRRLLFLEAPPEWVNPIHRVIGLAFGDAQTRLRGIQELRDLLTELEGDTVAREMLKPRGKRFSWRQLAKYMKNPYTGRPLTGEALRERWKRHPLLRQQRFPGQAVTDVSDELYRVIRNIPMKQVDVLLRTMRERDLDQEHVRKAILAVTGEPWPEAHKKEIPAEQFEQVLAKLQAAKPYRAKPTP